MQFIEGRIVALGLALLSLTLGVLFEEPLLTIVRDLGFDASRLTPAGRYVISGLFCFILGVAFAVGVLRNAAVAAWFTARRLRRLHDLEAAYGKPSVGWLPRVHHYSRPEEELRDPKSPIFESISSMADRVMNDFTDIPPRRILITSGVPAEGKTTVAFGLATMLARRGRQVLLIDADLRSPSQHRLLDLPNEFGFSNLAAGSDEVTRAVMSTDIPHLSVICSGPQPPNAGELLSGSVIAKVLEKLHEQFDVVIIDSPPVLGLADAPALARQCDFILYVVRYGFTNTGLATDTFKRISSIARAPIVLAGTALPSAVSGYGYGYSYHYAYDTPQPSSRRAAEPRWRRLLRYASRAAALGLVAWVFWLLVDFWYPDRLDQVGGGVTLARQSGSQIIVESWHGNFQGVDQALDAGSRAVARLARGVKDNLPPGGSEARSVVVRFTFSKEDRLGNIVRAPLLNLTFDRQDLTRVNLNTMKGKRLLGLAKSAYVWDADWPDDIAAYCHQHGREPAVASLCGTLSLAIRRPADELRLSKFPSDAR